MSAVMRSVRALSEPPGICSAVSRRYDSMGANGFESTVRIAWTLPLGPSPDAYMSKAQICQHGFRCSQ